MEEGFDSFINVGDGFGSHGVEAGDSGAKSDGVAEDLVEI